MKESAAYDDFLFSYLSLFLALTLESLFPQTKYQGYLRFYFGEVSTRLRGYQFGTSEFDDLKSPEPFTASYSRSL